MGKKQTAAEIDGVQYRRAKLWQIILYACNALPGMGVYMLIGMASYSASIGYGIATAVVGVILTCTRILDGITDPFVAFLFDRINTKHGKIRILLVVGYVIEAIALLSMYSFASSKGFGIVMFTFLYVIYILGYTITNITAQTIPALMSNDPKQRPVIGVWTTAFNYFVPMILTIVLNSVMLPMFGGSYNQAFLTAAAFVCVGVSGLGILLVCISVSAFDKPENLDGIGKKEPLRIKDMIEVLKHNKPLQAYIAAQASDKIAQQTVAQSVIVTMLYGIIIGNMTLATILSVVSMVPSIVFGAFGAKYAGKYGSKKGIVFWTKVCMVIAVIGYVFFIVIDPTDIAVMGSIPMVLYVLIMLAFNGAKMCVTTADVSFMADVIDYELDRSGRYVPAVVTGTYSLIDKIISSFSALIATGAVALLGYTSTMPQPTDPCTSAIFWFTITLFFGMPFLGWVITLIAMRGCKLDREEMVAVQKRIEQKKEEQKNA